MIATRAGSLGTCREYFDATLQKRETLGIRDAGMERLRCRLKPHPRRQAAAGVRNSLRMILHTVDLCRS